MANPIDMDGIDKQGVSMETPGNMELNGEAWKERGNTTYTSLLDMYGAEELFSQKSMALYEELNQQKTLQNQELTEYVFSDKIQEKSEENLAEQIFSEEIQFSRARDYNKTEEDYSICLILGEILFVLVFVSILIKINALRRKRGKQHAVEIDMEK